jgi:hypothetical protein
VSDDDRSVRGFERKQLLERIQRESATVGATIPDEITVQGEEIDLQQLVFEIRRRDTTPPGERERVDRALANLVEQIEERGRRPEPAHPAQNARAGMLERLVEVRDASRRLGHHVDKGELHLGRLEA